MAFKKKNKKNTSKNNKKDKSRNPKNDNKLWKFLKILLIGWAIFLIFLLILVTSVRTAVIHEADISEFETYLEHGWVETVTFKENLGVITYVLKEELFDKKEKKKLKIPKEYKDTQFYFVNETKVHSNYFILNPDIYKKVKSEDIKFEVKAGISFLTIIIVTIYSLFLLLIIALIFQMFYKTSKVSVDFIKEEPTRFSDIGGLSEVKKEIGKVVHYLENRDTMKEYVDNIPKGILFEGSPGNGKTLMARAIAGESDTPFFYISGADIEGMYVSIGATKVRKMFKRVKKAAKRHGRAILFIDELDSVGIKRENRTVVETNQTINAILTELDGFNKSDNILVIGATNLASQLDSALVRSGRFDRIINIPNPSENDRYEILNLYLQKRIDKVESNIFEIDYLRILAKQTHGMSGSDLSRLVNDSFLFAFEENMKVTVSHLRESFLRIGLGLPNTETLSETDRTIVAYHESAHAIVNMATNDLGYQSFAYGTIRPYANALGHVSLIPEAVVLNRRSDYYKEAYKLLAGRAIEDIILDNDFTDGASNDLMKVTHLLYQYLIKSGMSENNPNTYIDEKLTDLKEKWVQDEVITLRNKLYNETLDIVKENMVHIEKLKDYLLEHNDIDYDKITELFKDIFPNKSKRVIMRGNNDEELQKDG